MMEETHEDMERPPPYTRSGRRKSFLLSVVSTTLYVLLLILSLMLLFMLLPRSLFNSNCVWAGEGRRCFWPFTRQPPVVLITFDGFRHDYIDMVREQMGSNALPNFARLERTGVRANQTIPVFPTLTMPNHQTLVTGLYPQHHGVTGNNLFDHNYPNTLFIMKNQTTLNESPWLDDWPEPIWMTLQRAGGLVGSLLWPMTDRPIRDDLPFQQVSQFIQLNGYPTNYLFSKRVHDLMWWVQNSRFQLDLILAYFNEPAQTGHLYGPTSRETLTKVVQMDVVLGQILDGLEKFNMTDEINLILTSDHGMAQTSSTKVIPLDTYVSPQLYTYSYLSPMGAIYPKQGKEQEVYDKLKYAHEHLHVYWLKDVPTELHFNRSNSRMPPLVLIPDMEWSIAHTVNDPIPSGSDGYPNTDSDMHTFLIASGPSFRVGERVTETHAIDMYALLCALTFVHPKPHNGSLTRIAQILKPEVAKYLLQIEHWPHWMSWFVLEMQYLWIAIGLLVLIFLFVALCFSSVMQRKQTRRAHSSLGGFPTPPDYNRLDKELYT
ncbi:hypothetical protein EG68_05064 [Paragonimus skrjabini miyazakii]|uniref:Uncharacterized protein n=1 Tax=Paragonimus skrjabini miyazakii TaxID=59628 RepID=A0A8S9Z3X6_9TREM|nr:hypothetical protein EG68_05064 [Paragonimus skrjabini miyazakii]